MSAKDNPLEKKVEKTVCDYAREKGWLTYKFVSPMQAFVCDRIWICNGRTIYVEFKRRGKKPTPMQMRHHQDLVRHGCTVYVIDSIPLGKDIVDHETFYQGAGHHWAAVRHLGGEETASEEK